MLDLSVVVPVKNEAGNIKPLINEIEQALRGRYAYEIIYVDDGSTDSSVAELEEMRQANANVRYVQHRASCGQSAAVRTGVMLARGRLIATLDGDGQNDPADLPLMLSSYYEMARQAGGIKVKMVAGQRTKRNDSAVRRFSSRFANNIRANLLKDETPDTGCGLKLFEREAFLRLPYFDHMHRFLPALMQREGYSVALQSVNHRPRNKGTSKYGINNRLWVGIVDLLGVMWLQGRMKRPEVLVPEVDSEKDTPSLPLEV
ncbi:MAG: glycosyltransferase family 2 protein [Alphaproteobacteria bacterium]